VAGSDQPPQVVDTLGGGMHAGWDKGAAALPHRQLEFFAEVLLGTGVFWRGISGEALRQALQRLDEAASVAWMRPILRHPVREALDRAWVLDIGASIKPLDRRQEDAEIGAKPSQPTRLSHALHSLLVSPLCLVLDVQLSQGKQHAGGHAVHSAAFGPEEGIAGARLHPGWALGAAQAMLRLTDQLAAGDGMRLSRLLGRSRALEVVLGCDEVDAEVAGFQGTLTGRGTQAAMARCLTACSCLVRRAAQPRSPAGRRATAGNRARSRQSLTSLPVGTMHARGRRPHHPLCRVLCQTTSPTQRVVALNSQTRIAAPRGVP